MGGGPDPETVLVVLPFDEPTHVFERLKKKFPYVKVVFYRLNARSHPWDTGVVPPGEFGAFSLSYLPMDLREAFVFV